MKHKNVGDNKVLGPQGHIDASDANPKSKEGEPRDVVAAEAPRQTWWGWATGGTVETTETTADPGDDFEMVEDTNAPKLGAEKANKEEKAAVDAEEAEKEETEAFARAAAWAEGLDGREVGGDGDGVEVAEGTDEEGKVIAPEIADIHADANDGVEETAAEDSLAYFNGAGGEYGAGEELVKIRSGGVDYYLDEDADGNNVYIDHDGNVYNFDGVEEAEEEVNTEAGIRPAVNEEEAAQAGGERNEQWGESVTNTSWNEEDDDGINSDAETVIELEVPSAPQPQEVVDKTAEEDTVAAEAPRQTWLEWMTGTRTRPPEVVQEETDGFEVVQNPNAAEETAVVDAEPVRKSYAQAVGNPQYTDTVNANEPEGTDPYTEHWDDEEYTEPALTPTRGTSPYTRQWDDEDALVEDRHTAAAHRADKRVKKGKKPEPTSEKSAAEKSIELGKKLQSKQNILENLKKELKEAKKTQQELEEQIDPEIKALHDAFNAEPDKEKQQGGFISWFWGANTVAADEGRNSGPDAGSMREEEDSLRHDMETAERDVRGLELTVKQIQLQIRAIKEDLKGAEAAASAIEEEEAKMKAAAERHKNAVREERSREREEREEERKDIKSTAKAAAWVADLNDKSEEEASEEGGVKDLEEDEAIGNRVGDNAAARGHAGARAIAAGGDYRDTILYTPEAGHREDIGSPPYTPEEEDNGIFDPFSDAAWVAQTAQQALEAQQAGSGAPTDAEQDGLWEECQEIGNSMFDPISDKKWAARQEVAAQQAGSGVPTDAEDSVEEDSLWKESVAIGNRVALAAQRAKRALEEERALEAQQAGSGARTDVQDPGEDHQVADNVEGAESGWIDDDGVTNLDAQWAVGAPEDNESAYTSLYVMTDGDDPSGAATDAEDPQESGEKKLWEESEAIGARVALAAQQELGRITDRFNAPINDGFVPAPRPGEPVRVWDVQTHLLGGPVGGRFVPDIEETNIPNTFMGCFLGVDSVDGGSGFF